MPKSLMSTKSFRSARSKSRSPVREHHANASKSSFINPWPSAKAPTSAEATQHSFPFGWYPNTLQKHKHARKLEVVKPDWGASDLKDRKLDRSECVIGTWLGHASVLAEVPLHGIKAASGDAAGDPTSAWLLFDPIFSMRAGPTQYTGPRRFHNESPCQVADLPGCDAVFISHNHYDHLDFSTIKALLDKFPEARYFAPLGIRSWLITTGVPETQAFELDWWQDCELNLENLGRELIPNAKEISSLRFTCVPAQHNSGRAAIDSGSTLWCGWVVEHFLKPAHDPESINNHIQNNKPDDTDTSTSTPTTTNRPTNPFRKAAIYHAGDTGYRRSAKSTETCPAFREIGSKLGPFDLSFIPIWRGGTLGFVSSFGVRLSHSDISSAFHATPADAVAIHLDVKSHHTIPVHFGTFVGSENETYEAIIEFAEACDSNGVKMFGRNVDVSDDNADNDNDNDNKGNDSNEKATHGYAGILDIGGSYAVKLALN